LPGGNNGSVPNHGFTQFSLTSYGQNQCSGGFACGYVWNPVVNFYRSLSANQVASYKAISTLIGMLTGLYSKSQNPTYAANCQAGPQSCLSNILIPGIASAASPQDLFQLSRDNSLVWWSMQVGPGKLTELADAIDSFDNLGVPFLDLLSSYGSACGPTSFLA